MSSKHQPQGSRYASLQRGRTIVHPNLSQAQHCRPQADEHTFVVCADTQLGMTNQNREWETELEYSRQAIRALNDLQPRPLFCCVCGDLVDMTASIYSPKLGTPEEDCNRIQDEQNEDFKETWADLHPDIALVCVCGNHDVGNRPTATSVGRWKAAFGDDYLAFWANGTYNIVVNTSLFSDPSETQDLYYKQLKWLEERLKYAVDNNAGTIFVFGHHPWFLYREDEATDELTGKSPYPPEWNMPGVFESDGYFHIPLQYRRKVMDLFRDYNVSAAFAGHFHQNLVSQSSFGMDMIVTSSLSMVFKSSGIPDDFKEPNTRGFRVVRVARDPSTGVGAFEHKFVSL